MTARSLPTRAASSPSGELEDVERRARRDGHRRVFPRPTRRARGTVTPGLIDPHTHLLFAGTRQAEVELRQRGHGYLEILAAGGGILQTVRETRAAPDDVLLANARRWLAEMVSHGVTTVEVKSGYGLAADEELRLLSAHRRARQGRAARHRPDLPWRARRRTGVPRPRRCRGRVHGQRHRRAASARRRTGHRQRHATCSASAASSMSIMSRAAADSRQGAGSGRPASCRPAQRHGWRASWPRRSARYRPITWAAISGRRHRGPRRRR